jgi:dimethylargininase
MLPDAVFIEDTAIVVDELAVIARMGALRRRDEVKSLITVLANYRPLEFLESPATLEGGDVIRIGRTLYVGESSRTNAEGIAQLRAILAPYDYDVRAVKVNGCLHLSTGCSYLGRGAVLLNRSWIDARPFEWAEIIDAPAREPWAANILSIGEVALLSSGYPQTRVLVEQHGFQVDILDISEFEKAEAGLTCMSLTLNPIGSREA